MLALAVTIVVHIRIAVDKTTNHLGRELISTLRALDMYIVNGRFNNISDDGFTSISSRGMSVVNYIISPIKSFKALSNFRVWMRIKYP